MKRKIDLNWIILDTRKNNFGDWQVIIKNIKTNAEERYVAYEGEHEMQRKMLLKKYGLLI